MTAKPFTFVVDHRASCAYDGATPKPRCFRQPWSVEDVDNCFVVKAQDGQELAYIYYEDDRGRRAIVKLLSRGEARRIAAAIAKLPDVVHGL